MSTLSDELANDPEGLGYAAMDDAACAALLNATTGPGSSSVLDPAARLSELTLLGLFDTLDPTGGADRWGDVLADIRGSAKNRNKELARLFDRLVRDDEGLPIGTALAQKLIDKIAADTILTAGEAAAVKSLGFKAASRAEVLGLPRVRGGHVQAARAE